MNTMSHYNIKVINEVYGTLVDEDFVNPSQFKLFLKMIQGCITMKEDLTFFNGVDFLIHIPFNTLVKSVITTKTHYLTLTDQLINKSKIESPISK
jgi:hypothetical protein